MNISYLNCVCVCCYSMFPLTFVLALMRERLNRVLGDIRPWVGSCRDCFGRGIFYSLFSSGPNGRRRLCPMMVDFRKKKHTTEHKLTALLLAKTTQTQFVVEHELESLTNEFVKAK